MRGNFQGKKRREVLATVRQSMESGPRAMEVYVLKEGIKYTDLLSYPHEEPSLEELYEVTANKSLIHFFRTRKPKWMGELSQYILNFAGRITEASVRNFILEDPLTHE